MEYLREGCHPGIGKIRLQLHIADSGEKDNHDLGGRMRAHDVMENEYVRLEIGVRKMWQGIQGRTRNTEAYVRAIWSSHMKAYLRFVKGENVVRVWLGFGYGVVRV